MEGTGECIVSDEMNSHWENNDLIYRKPLAKVVMGTIGVTGKGVNGGFGVTTQGFNARFRFDANIRISISGSINRALVPKGSSAKYGDASNRDIYYAYMDI
jgi:hypothetical protein